MTSSGSPSLRDRDIPGWTVRGALVAAIAGLVAVALMHTPDVGLGTIFGPSLLVVACIAVVAPGGMAPMVLIGGVVVFRAFDSGPSLDWSLAVSLPLLTAVHQLAALAAAVPLRAVCPLRVFRPAAIRFAWAVGVVEVVVLLLAIVI